VVLKPAQAQSQVVRREACSAPKPSRLAVSESFTSGDTDSGLE